MTEDLANVLCDVEDEMESQIQNPSTFDVQTLVLRLRPLRAVFELVLGDLLPIPYLERVKAEKKRLVEKRREKGPS